MTRIKHALAHTAMSAVFLLALAFMALAWLPTLVAEKLSALFQRIETTVIELEMDIELEDKEDAQ